MADSITGEVFVLSAIFKAKADTKDGADGFSRERETITFFDFFRCPKILCCYPDSLNIIIWRER